MGILLKFGDSEVWAHEWTSRACEMAGKFLGVSYILLFEVRVCHFQDSTRSVQHSKDSEPCPRGQSMLGKAPLGKNVLTDLNLLLFLAIVFLRLIFSVSFTSILSLKSDLSQITVIIISSTLPEYQTRFKSFGSSGLSPSSICLHMLCLSTKPNCSPYLDVLCRLLISHFSSGYAL